MRTLSASQLEVLSKPIYSVAVRVWICDSDGTWRDLSSLQGFNWIQAVEISDSVDQPVMTAAISLWRNVYYWSLAIQMSTSGLNQNSSGAYAPLIDLGRKIKIETATIPEGAKPTDDDWQNVFEGQIDEVDWAKQIVTLNCRDLGGVLQDLFIETKRSYGADDGSVDSEQVIQQMLDDNGTGVTLAILTPSNWATKKMEQSKEPLLTAITNVALQRGWTVKYKCNSGTGVWWLTYYEPDRTKATPDYTFSPDKYFDVSRLTLNISKIRTVVRVQYGEGGDANKLKAAEYPITGNVTGVTSTTLSDSSKTWTTNQFAGFKVMIVAGLGKGQARTIVSNTANQLTVATWSPNPNTTSKYAIVEAADSANPLYLYGRRFMEITEASTSQIDTYAEAYRMVRAIYQDVSAPEAEQEISTRYFFPIEIGDLYTWKANGVHYDNDQNSAVIAYSHKLEGGQGTTTITTRGKPAGAFEAWFKRQVWPGVAMPASLPNTPTGLTITTGLEEPQLSIWAYLLVSWAANPETDITFYQVAYRQWTGSAWGDWCYIVVNGTSQKISGLKDDTQYQVQVQVFNKRGYASGWAGPTGITTEKYIYPPPIPTNFVIASSIKGFVINQN